MQGAFGGNGQGTKTATAGTKIRYLMQPNINGYTRVTKIVYTAAGTAHTLTLLRPIGRSTASAAAAASATALPVAAEMGPSGNALAANDLIAVRETDGVTRFYTVSAVPGGYPGNVTINALVAGVALGGKIWNFGVEADTNPADGNAHPAVAGTASVTSTYQDSDGGVVATFAKDDPILFTSDNATAAGTLNQLTFSFTQF